MDILCGKSFHGISDKGVVSHANSLPSSIPHSVRCQTAIINYMKVVLNV